MEARCSVCWLMEPHDCLELEDFTRSGEARPMPEAVHFEGDLKGEVKAAYDKFMSTRRRRQFTTPLRYGKGPQR